MNTYLIIFLVILVDILAGQIANYYKLKKEKKEIDNFVYSLEKILDNKDQPIKERIIIGMELCRRTEGSCSYSAYVALDNIYHHIISQE